MSGPESKWLIRVASRVVPRGARASWLRRQEAELWHAELTARRAGRSDGGIRRAVARRAVASFPEALWERIDRERTQQRIRDTLRTPHFCLAVLTLLLAVVAVLSGGLARTQRIVKGTGFGHGDRVITICLQERLVGRRQGVAPASLRKWRAEGKSFEQFSAYTFPQPWYQNGFLLNRGPKPAQMAHAQVLPEFFDVLGVTAERGRLLGAGDLESCGDCLVVTQRLKRELLGTSESVIGRSIDFEGRRRRIIGELGEDFWFVTERLGAISLMDAKTAQGRIIGLGLLRPGVSVEAAEKELRRVARLPEVEAASLSERLRGPIRTFGLGSLALLLMTAAATLAGVLRRRSQWRFWVFFFGKTAIVLAIVLLVVVDYGGAGQLSITGGNQPSEPVAFWAWMVGSVLCLWWSIADQKMRCRVCLRRFEMPVRIGSPDRVLFEHESTEMVCPDGHGTLYVEGMTETFRQEGRWTKLDESWRDLFAGKR